MLVGGTSENGVVDRKLTPECTLRKRSYRVVGFRSEIGVVVLVLAASTRGSKLLPRLGKLHEHGRVVGQIRATSTNALTSTKPRVGPAPA